MSNAVNTSQSATDPAVELTLPDGEVVDLIYDYRVGQAITRLTGVNPLLRGPLAAMSTPDGIHVCIWACITQPGEKWNIPKDYRNYKLEQILQWCEEDFDFVDRGASAVIAAARAATSRTKKKDAPPDPDPNEQQTTATATT